MYNININNNDNISFINLLISYNKILKRNMFTKIKPSKKSSEISIFKESSLKYKNTIGIENTSTNLNSPFLSKIELGSNIPIKKENDTVYLPLIKYWGIGNNIIKQTEVNRQFATMSQIDKRYPVKEIEVEKDCNVLFTYSEHHNVRIDKLNNLYNLGKISSEQQLCWIKRMTALNFSYEHQIVLDVIEQTDTHVKIMYNVITTKDKIVDYGGPNVFNPVFLYKDKNNGKSYYTIKLTYLQKVDINVFNKYMLLKNEKDSEKTQIILVEKVKEVQNLGDFCVFDVDKEYLEVNICEINVNYKFPLSTYIIKSGWVKPETYNI